MKQVYFTFLTILFSFVSYAAVISPITGAGSVCQGSTLHLSDATGGGTWSSSNPSIATVGSSSGIVTGISAGMAVITYTVGASNVTATVTVNALPGLYSVFVAGSGGICAGGAGEHIFLSGSETGVNYQLYNGASAVGTAVAGTGAAIDFGAISTAGTYTATATNTTTGCIDTMSGSATITVLPTPAAIGGPSSVCIGATITLTDATTGGTWSSTSPSVATIGSTGIVSGVATGSTTISYTLSSGCAATTTINAINLISPITGTSSVCTGTTATLSDASPGGTWVSSNPSVATIGSSSGIISGIASGTTTISYAVGSSCGVATSTVAVHTTPAAITGITSICAGAVSTLSDITPGGTWSSSNTAVATIGSTSGIATSISSGTATISYTLAGCSATTGLSVDPRPVISGPTNVCVTSSIVLHTTINGSWTSSNPAVATVSSGFMIGIVTGVYPGTAVMTCNSYSTGCVSTYTVTVTSACTGTPAAGTAHAAFPTVCSGNADTLYLTGYSNSCGISYQWQYSTDSLAWANLTGATSDTAFIHPQATLYYRCKLTCFAGGAYSYSAGVKVTAYNHITAQSVIASPAATCAGPDFHLSTCGIAPGTNVLTWYGDGTSDSTHLFSSSADSSAQADIYHNYSFPGTYTVKQVLRNGTTRQDSVTFFYNYNYCHTLPASFYFDANSNCINDNGDGNIYRPVTTEIDSNGVPVDTITAINGFFYNALGIAGTVYSFRIIAHDTGLHLSCPAAGVLYDTIGTFVNTYVTKSFGFSCNASSGFNLGIAANLTAGMHTANGYIEVNNTYCNADSAVVVMNFSNKYNFVSGWPAPYSIAGNTITWHVPSLNVYNPASATWPYIWYTLSAAVPALTVGDTVNSSYKITPYSGDVDTTNNFVARVDTIKSSYGQNRISVSPRGFTIPCTPLVYTINFKNTGSDTAHNLAIIDTLPDNVNPATLKLIAASGIANMATERSGSHTIVKFDFPHINLPDSSHHNQCDGVVVFSVQAKQSLADSTTLINSANIYIDDRLPVQTNTVTTQIGVSAITGASYVCAGTHIQLNDLSEQGTWTASNTHASGSSGMVTGVTPGVDTIKYTLSNTCATRTETKVVSVNAVVVPTVTLVNSLGTTDTVCEGVIPVFTVTPVNGGTAPSYVWQVNGSGSDTGAVFSYIPTDGDTLSVTMTSNAICAIPDTANKTIALTVIPPYAPPVILDAYPGLFISAGTADTFVATVPTGGPTPTYQWLLNGTPIAGATTDTFISTTLHNNDSVTVIVTGTDLCKLSTFNSVIVNVGNVGVKNISSKVEMVLFPNPNNGQFTIKGKTGQLTDEPVNIEIINMLGNVVYRTTAQPDNGFINQQITPDNRLARGMYLLNLHSGGDNVVFRFEVE